MLTVDYGCGKTVIGTKRITKSFIKLEMDDRTYSTHKQGHTARTYILAKQLQEFEGRKRAPRRGVSLGNGSALRNAGIKKDMGTVMKICSAVTNVLTVFVETEKVAVNTSSFRKRQMKEKGTRDSAIEKFFGFVPDEDSDWNHNLWCGRFYPVIAFFSVYEVKNIEWDSVDEIDQSTISFLKQSYQPMYAVAYVMAVVYGRLAKIASDLVQDITSEKSLRSGEWSDIKVFTAVAFDCVHDTAAMYKHIAALITQDRRLRQVQKILPRIEPWSKADRFFAKRPTKPSSVSVKYIKQLVKAYQPDLLKDKDFKMIEARWENMFTVKNMSKADKEHSQNAKRQLKEVSITSLLCCSSLLRLLMNFLVSFCFICRH